MTLTTADRIEISELISRSHFYADYGDYEKQRGCFSADTVCIIDGLGQFPGIDWQVEHAKVSARNTNGKNRHVVTNLWIEEQPDGSAIAHYFMLNVNAGSKPKEPYIAVCGEFHDGVRRDESGWKVVLRRFVSDQPFELVNNGV